MPKTKRIELAEDDVFQRREWLIQRIGWAIWACILIAGLAGLVGPGPLSNAESSTSNGSLNVRYDRFVHYHHPTTIDVMLGPAPEVENAARIKVSQQLLDDVQVLRIEPEPQQRELAADGVVYTFPRTAESERSKIKFHVEFERFGATSAAISLVGQPPVEFTQFVYP